MAKMTVLGNDVRTLTDCSEVIPVPKPAASNVAHLPAGKTLKDIEAACAATPFPALSAAPGPATTIAPVYVPSLSLVLAVVIEANCMLPLVQPPLLNDGSQTTIERASVR